jgi:hypothetical protein
MLPAAGLNINVAWIVLVAIQVVAQALLIVFYPGLQIDGIARSVVAFFSLRLCRLAERELILCASFVVYRAVIGFVLLGVQSIGFLILFGCLIFYAGKTETRFCSFGICQVSDRAAH